MAIKLVSSNDLATNHGVKCLTYARAGMGKTVLSATAPRPIILSAESGLLSLKKENLVRLYGADKPTISYDMPVIEIKTVDDITEAHKWFLSSNEASGFDTVCIDSISEIGEVILSNAKIDAKDPRQAYGELIDKLAVTVRAFRDLSEKHIYVTAKEEFGKDEVTGVKSFQPSLPGSKLSQQIPYWFDEMFNLGIAKTQEGVEYRYLRTQPDMQYQAKDRSGCLDEIEQPNLTHIFNKIMAG